MWIRKETGGNSIRWRDGIEYTWPVEDPVCEVPDELGRELLAIPEGGCTETEPPAVPEDDSGEAGNGEGDSPEGDVGEDDGDPEDGAPGGDEPETETGPKPARRSRKTAPEA